jgi:hypothetical protein
LSNPGEAKAKLIHPEATGLKSMRPEGSSDLNAGTPEDTVTLVLPHAANRKKDLKISNFTNDWEGGGDTPAADAVAIHFEFKVSVPSGYERCEDSTAVRGVTYSDAASANVTPTVM